MLPWKTKLCFAFQKRISGKFLDAKHQTCSFLYRNKMNSLFWEATIAQYTTSALYLKKGQDSEFNMYF